MSLSSTVEPFVADIGITLRDGRIQRGLTIDQVAQETRISARFLEALEAEAFDELPAPVYVRGFLRSYANFLRIDAGPLLEQLSAATNRPISGPDSFVGGAPGLSRGPRQRPPTNPFRSGTPAPRPASRPTPFEPPAPVLPQGAFADAEDEGWAPEVPAGTYAEEPLEHHYAPGPAVADDYDESSDYDAPEPQYRPRRVAGVLMEREGTGGGGPAPARLLAIAGGAVVLVLFFLAVAVIMTGGGGDSTNVAAPAVSPTPTSRPGTVIAVGTAARPSATASPSASASASPGASPSPSATPGTPTPAPQGNTPAPTAAATPTPTPTETPTPAAPTPRPPTPAPTPPPPSAFQECTKLNNGDLDCGGPPYRIVCYPPNGLNDWFVDRGKDYSVPSAAGWRTTEVSTPSLGTVLTAGRGGC
jgi:hypothetical protein